VVRFALLAFFVVAGCGPAITLDGTGEGDDGDTGAATGNDDAPGATTSPPPATTVASTSGVTPTSGDESTDGGNTFLEPTGDCLQGAPDGTSFHCLPPDEPCSTWEQDCPEGEKCMPWAGDGGSNWTWTRCSPISDTPGQLGESCSVEGSNVSGIDTCDLGLMCWGVDPQTLTGECAAMCTGDPSAPVCPADHSCSITNDGVLNLCLLDCDPIAMDCPTDQCVPIDDAFGCVPSSGEQLPGEPCEQLAECISGAACIPADNVPDCAGANGCCSDFCDLASPDPTLDCLPGQVCLPWYERGISPPEYEHVGVCGVEAPA
jgi:hypothetical protein